MNNVVINLNNIKNKFMYLAWLSFFILKTVFSSYVGPEIQVRALIVITVTYLLIDSFDDGKYILKSIKIPWVSVLMGLFVFYASLSMRWATEVTNGGYSINLMIQQNLFVLICMELYWGKKERIIDLLKIFCFAMFIYGLVATFTTPISAWGSEYTYGGFTGVHRNTASLIFVICFGISYYLYTIYKERKYIIAVGGFFFFNLVTGARKGIIQILFIIAMIVLLQDGLEKKIKIFSGLIVAFSILAIVFVNSPFLQETYGARLLAVFDDSIADGSRDSRKMFRLLALLGFLDRPIVGNGSGYTTAIIRAVTGEAVYSHCNYTEMLCNYGLIGFILNYSIYIVSIIRGFRNRVNSFGKMVFILVLSILIIEYGQVTFQIMSGIIPLYILFLLGLYGVEIQDVDRKEV